MFWLLLVILIIYLIIQNWQVLLMLLIGLILFMYIRQKNLEVKEREEECMRRKNPIHYPECKVPGCGISIYGKYAGNICDRHLLEWTWCDDCKKAVLSDWNRTCEHRKNASRIHPTIVRQRYIPWTEDPSSTDDDD